MIIELSHPITPNLPVYPGDPNPAIFANNTIENDGFSDHSLTLGTHAGTHIDAPAHMLVGGKTLDSYPPSRFIGRGILVEATTNFSLDSLKKLYIESGNIVVFRTGMSQQFSKPGYFAKTPSIPEDIIRYLAEKRISMIGVDTWTIDSAPFNIHKFLLGADILIIENLTNLEQLPDEFTIIAMPLNLPLDGAPCRVIAFTEPIPALHQTP